MGSAVDTFMDKARSATVLVVGDVMLDAYLWGHVERISPEAPVPVVQVTERSARLGGAANVALNLRAMGAVPFASALPAMSRDAGTVRCACWRQKRKGSVAVRPARVARSETSCGSLDSMAAARPGRVLTASGLNGSPSGLAVQRVAWTLAQPSPSR